MSDQQQRVWVHAHVEEIMRNTILRIGGEVGLHIVETTEYIIGLGIKMYAVERGNAADPFILAQADLLLATERQQVRRTLIHLVTIALRQQDEDELDRIRERCDQLNLTFEEIVKEAQDDRNPLRRIEYSDNRLNKAELWLLEHMQPEEEYWANDINDQASAEGISASMIKSAKKTLGVRSKRRSRGWAWTMPSPADLTQPETATEFVEF